MQLLVLIILSAWLSLRRDAYFPLSENTAEGVILAFTLVQIIAFIFLVGVFFLEKHIQLGFFYTVHNWVKRHLRSITIITFAISIIATAGLFVVEQLKFTQWYSLDGLVLFVATVISVVLVVIPILQRKAVASFFGLILATVLMSIIPILFFPITAKNADLMPIVIAQTQALVGGESLYQYFVLDNGSATQAVRQPGMAVSYLPAELLNIDYRWMSLLYIIGTALILFKLAYTKIQNVQFDHKFLKVLLAIGIFLLMPYRMVRFDLYEPPFWFLLALSIYLVLHKKYLLYAICWGLGIFTQVWFWLFTPFLAVYLWSKEGFRKAFVISTLKVAIGAASITLFVGSDPAVYFEHVFGFYDNYLATGRYESYSLYLTPFLIKLGLTEFVGLIQLAAVAIIGLLSLRFLTSTNRIFIFLTAALLALILFNSLSWNYMYINILYLMIIGVLVEYRNQKKNSKRASTKNQDI